MGSETPRSLLRCMFLQYLLPDEILCTMMVIWHTAALIPPSRGKLFKIPRSHEAKTTMSEQRGALYRIRWEILVMCASLALTVIAILLIPNDFTEKMLEEQKEQKEAAEQRAASEEMEESAPGEMEQEEMTEENSGGTTTNT